MKSIAAVPRAMSSRNWQLAPADSSNRPDTPSSPSSSTSAHPGRCHGNAV